MGRDKGLMEKDGMVWAGYMGEKLERQGLRVIYSVREVQVAAYEAAMPGASFVIDDPALDAVQGPLKGLLSVHERLPLADLLLLGCDMLDMDEPTIVQLIDRYEAGEAFFYAYKEGAEFWQPLCAIYRREGLAGVSLTILEGRQDVLSLQMLLRRGPTGEVGGASPGAFENYNTL
jgi:molybdopterin-guanine dinucleotide biosynthesis protein A